MEIGAVSSIGNIRENNQDSMYVSEDSSFPIFIVADGMGGHKAGEVASSLAIEATITYLKERKDLLNNEENIKFNIKKAIKYANEKIYSLSQEISEYSGMGTTITLSYIFDSKIILGHVGDSRAYLISDCNIKQVTKDHSLVSELIEQGSITTEEALTHPQRHLITRAVGTSQDIDVDIYMEEFKSNDKLILCSDGLTNMVDDDTILSIVNDNEEAEINKLSKILATTANDNGGKDNITIIIVKKGGGLL